MCMSCCICAKSIWYIVLRINEWCDAPIYWMGWNVGIVCFGIGIGMSSFLFVLCFTWMCIAQSKLFWGAFRFYRFRLMLMETLLYTLSLTLTHAHAQCISRARKACRNSLAAIFNNRAHSIRAIAPIWLFSFEFSIH